MAFPMFAFSVVKGTRASTASKSTSELILATDLWSVDIAIDVLATLQIVSDFFLVYYTKQTINHL